LFLSKKNGHGDLTGEEGKGKTGARGQLLAVGGGRSAIGSCMEKGRSVLLLLFLLCVLLPHAVRRKKKGEEREKREEKEGKKNTKICQT
jgi:hypothetical protein